MITLILPNPPLTVIKGIQYLQTEGDLISYHLSVNTSELVEARVIFRDYKGFRYIVALLDEKINLDLARSNGYNDGNKGN